ncbi:unnamed protein product [Effrenium voratum]|nr:unnamed protein product [Effrenium voratum]
MHVARCLLEAGSDTDRADNNGNTCMHFAATCGYERMVHCLLEAGADKDKANHRGRTVMHDAASHGFTGIVNCLLRAGADMNKRDAEGSMPMHLAARYCHRKIARALIEKGADTNDADSEGCTPMHFAAENGDQRVARCLLEAGADRNKLNNEGYTPTQAPCPWLDGKHVVFGHMVGGEEVLDAIEACGTEGGRPKARVWIHNCGEETQKFLRKEALESGYVEDPAAKARAAMEAQAADAAKVPRPEHLAHIDEISPVPDEVWKRAKAYSENLL